MEQHFRLRRAVKECKSCSSFRTPAYGYLVAFAVCRVNDASILTTPPNLGKIGLRLYGEKIASA